MLAWRAILPLIAVGLILLVVSVFLVGRDLAFARAEAEAEVLAVAETSALALETIPASDSEKYLDALLKHPAIAMATVYRAEGERTTKRRAPATDTAFMDRMLPSFRQPIVGCREFGERTVCLEADPAYFRNRAAALVIPHGILLLASASLLLAALVLGRGSNREQVSELTRIVRGAAEESNFAVRAKETSGEMGQLARAINALLEQMHQRDLTLRRRTTELESVNRELEAFSYSVSHDLRGPLASVDGFAQALTDFNSDQLDDAGREYLGWIRDAVEQMKNLIAGLLQMSRVTRAELKRAPVDLTAMAGGIAQSLQQRSPERKVQFRIQPNVIADADERLLHAVLENLMSNAFKFTSKKDDATISVGTTVEGDRKAYFVKDNGAGFDSAQAAKMFTAFQRLHSSTEFEGTGIGLSTVKRIIERHGGTIWADGQIGQGATFYFTLGEEKGSGLRAPGSGEKRELVASLSGAPSPEPGAR